MKNVLIAIDKRILHGALVAGVIFLLMVQTAHASGTATLSGHIYLDDNCNTIKDKPTDSNGLLDSGEMCVAGGVKVYFIDSNGLHFVMADGWGNYTTTVSTLTDVVVYIAPWDLALPNGNFEPTTQDLYTFTLADDSSTVVPMFAYGPKQ